MLLEFLLFDVVFEHVDGPGLPQCGAWFGHGEAAMLC
jgi:hypothetical protein